MDAPARLSPDDLGPLRAVVGDGALDYLLVAGSFHFINRIADLLDVDAEALPESLRRFEMLRRVGVRAASFLMARMDLANRVYPYSYEEALARMGTLRPPGNDLAPLAPRPKLVEVLQLALEDRARSTLDRTTLAAIHRTVEAALPATADDTSGFHARPANPVEAFAFVGTRYAHRATEEMIAGLRRAGHDDLGILDLAIAVADANQWARMHRLVGLRPGLFYLEG